jgi:hypothetical protein
VNALRKWLGSLFRTGSEPGSRPDDERRSGADRRAGDDRRSSFGEPRSAAEERRGGADRRSGDDRRSS